jgi:hypothetical protein
MSGLETGEAALSLAAADGVIIDFEKLKSDNDEFNPLPGKTHSEGGFTLVNTLDFLSPGAGNLLYSGPSAALMSVAGGETTLSMSMEDPGGFNVESIDIIESPLSGTVAIEIIFIGTKAGGLSVSKKFTTDGVPGPQTLDLSFTNIESLSWVQAGPLYHFDNIYITFPLDPQTRADCMRGGWRRNFDGFRNQGQCVRFVERNENRKDKR